MPAAGLPVASMTISTSGAAISAGASSVMYVVPRLRRLGDRARGVALRGPSGARERRARALGREVGDARRRGCPACASPARDTSRRTCRRRSARRAAACRRRRAPAAGDADSWLVPGCNASSASTARTPCGPTTRRAVMPSRAAASTLIALSSTNSTFSARVAERVEDVLEIVGVRLEAADGVRRKVVRRNAIGQRPFVAEALPVQLVGVRQLARR